VGLPGRAREVPPRPTDLPPLLDIAAIHYQFEAVHPFVDGNGRVGRLLVVLLLVEWGLLPGPVLDLSAYIEPRRDRYYDGLLTVSTRGDWTSWFQFMLEVFEEQAADAVRRTRGLEAVRTDYRDRVMTSRSSALLLRLVDELFRVPAVTIPLAQEVLGVTHRAASQSVTRLVDLGILEERPSRGRRRLFLASEVLGVTEGSGERPAVGDGASR
jgi:Fic family protein